VERILVRFEGEGSGTGELSWGQKDIWDAIRRLRSSLGIGGLVPLTPGTTVDDVAAKLGLLMSRHQALRTRLRFGPGDRVRQAVSRAGEVALEVVEVAADDDPVQAGKALYTAYHDEEFDYEHEWPVRMAVLRHRGVLTHLVALVCHLATDGFGAHVLRADLSNMDSGWVPPVTAMQPLEQARWQRGPAGRRHNDVALRYWEGVLRAISARRFPDPKGWHEPRYLDVLFASPALHLSALKVAERTGVGSTSVLLAAFAVALARVTGINPVVAQTMVGNRFRPGLAEAVSPLCHAGLCVMDVDGVPFEKVVGRAWRAQLNACKHAYYDPDGMLDLVDRISTERGERIERECFFNDRRSRYRQEASADVDERDIHDARGRTTMRVVSPLDPECEPFFLHINDVPDAVDIRLSVDTQRLAPPDVEAFLYGMERVAVEAALAG
jgi:hypothetical protein